MCVLNSIEIKDVAKHASLLESSGLMVHPGWDFISSTWGSLIYEANF